MIQIFHKRSQLLIAQGPKGWGFMPFEGNYYVSKKYLKTDRFRVNYRIGFCPYKFFYVWLNLGIDQHTVLKNAAWCYFLPNPLLPFIWYRVGILGNHSELSYRFKKDG